MLELCIHRDLALVGVFESIFFGKSVDLSVCSGSASPVSDLLFSFGWLTSRLPLASDRAIILKRCFVLC